MKQLTLDQPATKSDLNKLAQMTKSDLNKLAQMTKSDLNKLAQMTKSDLDNLEQRIEKEFALFRIVIREETKETVTSAIVKLQEQLSSFANQMYSRIDPLLKEIETAREDRILTTEALNKHEKRITRLEKFHPVTHD